jgi:hypothetical protein
MISLEVDLFNPCKLQFQKRTPLELYTALQYLFYIFIIFGIVLFYVI